jgi:hypothetical protein
MSVTVVMLVEAANVKITCQYGTRECQYVRLDVWKPRVYILHVSMCYWA